VEERHSQRSDTDAIKGAEAPSEKMVEASIEPSHRSLEETKIRCIRIERHNERIYTKPGMSDRNRWEGG